MKIRCSFSVLVLLSVFFPNIIQAQARLSSKEQHQLVLNAKKMSLKNHDTHYLNDLIDSDKLGPKYLSYAYFTKANVLHRNNREILENSKDSNTMTNPLVLEILSDYDKAIQACSAYELYVKKDRYEFMDKIAPKNTTFAADYKELKASGYKKPQNGPLAAIHIFQGKDTWMGVSLAVFGVKSPKYKLEAKRDKEEKHRMTWKTRDLSIDGPALHYNRNLNRPVNDFSFSLVELYAPIVLNFTTFGFQWGKDAEGKPFPFHQTQVFRQRWFYRPEIGIGTAHFSLSYAYNLMFYKPDRADSETHMVHLRYCFILK